MTVKVFALYLPQFHATPENDLFWGKDFTEWTNVKKATPLFKGHYQPHMPTTLGYYNLLESQVRNEQASMALEYGIDAFCYYHYWFAGKRVLELPIQKVHETGEPYFPFFLCWANQSWTGIWHGCPERILIEQTYPSEADFIAHFYALLPAFKDRRYSRVKEKPIFAL